MVMVGLLIIISSPLIGNDVMSVSVFVYRVCMFLSVSVRSHIYFENHAAQLPQMLRALPAVAMARSSLNGLAIRYLFPVLWMMLCFHTMGCGSMTRHVHSYKRRERNS